jgi:hypothetical protein
LEQNLATLGENSANAVTLLPLHFMILLQLRSTRFYTFADRSTLEAEANFSGGDDCQPWTSSIGTEGRRGVWSGVDVRSTIFCDFWQFSAKKMAFFSKTNVMVKFLNNLALFWVKNDNFFADFFGENI